jgi:Glycosyl hydrolase family 26
MNALLARLVPVLLVVPAACSDDASAPGSAGSVGGHAAADSPALDGSSGGSAMMTGHSGSAGAATAGAGMAGNADPASSGGGAGASNGGGGGVTTGGGGSTAIDAGSAAGPSASLIPAEGISLGAFIGYGEAQIVATETMIGRKLAIDHRFYGWTDSWVDQHLTDDLAAGRVPMISWQPDTGKLDDIIAGKHDALVSTQAIAAKAKGQPIFLRWAHEMNGNWYPWGGANNGGAAGGPAKYIAAWRHMRDLFKTAGATNVVWIWCVNVGSSPNEPWNDATAYYPGDDYVDWIGIDGYNWGTTQTWSTWRSFTSFISPYYQTLSGKGKPIMIPETGAVEQGGDKAAWIADMRAVLKTSFPAIKSLVYFHTIDTINNVNWKIDTSQGSLNAFAAMGKDAYFNPR